MDRNRRTRKPKQSVEGHRFSAQDIDGFWLEHSRRTEPAKEALRRLRIASMERAATKFVG